MFTSTYNKGFQMSFDNGLTISVQFGSGNYCSVKDLSKMPFSEMKTVTHSSKTAEVAVWDKQDNMFYFPNSHPYIGWERTEEVAKMIYKVSKAKNLIHLAKLFGVEK